MFYEVSQTVVGRDFVPSPPRWKGTRSLDLVHQLNERCLELLAEGACAGECENSLAMQQQRQLWRSLDVATRRRIARLPFVIVDVHFTDIAWWEQARDPTCRLRREAEAEGRPPSRHGEQLMHETLMFAWHMAQSDPLVSCLTVGLSREVSAAIGGLSTTDIRRIASIFTHDVGPRWGDRSDLWRNLILAAQGNDENAFAKVRLQAELRLVGDLVTALQSYTTRSASKSQSALTSRAESRSGSP